MILARVTLRMASHDWLEEQEPTDTAEDSRQMKFCAMGARSLSAARTSKPPREDRPPRAELQLKSNQPPR